VITGFADKLNSAAAFAKYCRDDEGFFAAIYSRAILYPPLAANREIEI
jgi:hypothetical protein